MKPIEKSVFGKRADGENSFCYKLMNDGGAYVEILDYGATILRIVVPDRVGRLADVVVGKDRLDQFMDNTCYNGSTIGRMANRILGGEYAIDGKAYHTELNELGDTTLHSGQANYGLRFFDEDRMECGNAEASVRFCIRDSGAGGFEVPLVFYVCYTFGNDGELSIEYEAKLSGKTVIAPTNHCFFNLSGEGNGPVLDHLLTVNADAYTPFPREDDNPDGSILDVGGTPFDFRQGVRLGDRVPACVPFYDCNFVLNDTGFRKVAEVYDPGSGRRMTVSTDMPGMQLYTCAFPLAAQISGKADKRYGPDDFYCLETQYFPNAVRMKNFYAPVFRAGVTWTSKTTYRFDCDSK